MNRLKTILATSVCAAALATGAIADSFDIPAGDLKTALELYALQTGTQLVVSGDAVRGTRTKGVKGDLSSGEALTRLLSGTGFTVRDSAGSLAIIRNQKSSLEVQSLQLAQANPSTGRIEEVLVTARKREEAVENIPISITALSAEDLKTYGVRNFADLEGVVPGLSMGGGGNGVKKDGNPFIRGVGQRETKVTLDPAVGTYIDGVYIGRAGGALLDVVDIDNVQVLRGPQGTLFGRNATGGAISVTLKKPTNDFTAEITANIGNYGRRDLTGIVNIPFIEDKVMGRLVIASINSNGYFTNTVDNTKWGGDNRVTGIAQLRILPTDNITVDLLGERTRIRETPRPQRCAFIRSVTTIQMNLINGTSDPANMVDGLPRYEGLCKRSEALPPSQFASDAAIGSEVLPKARYWVDTSTAAATVNWDVGNIGPVSDLNVKSISAWRKSAQIADEDLDAVPAQYLIRIQPYADETTQWSQELQISGKAFHDRLFISTGGYYFKEETPRSDLLLSAGISPPRSNPDPFLPDYPFGYHQYYFAEAAKERLQTHNEAFAWYGQADFDVTPEIQATAGMRWTREIRWSRYSKAYVDPQSVFAGDIGLGLTTNGLQVINQKPAFAGEPPQGLNPALSWTYSNRQYFFTNPAGTTPSPIGNNLVPNFFIGDELKFANEAWTPMASLKYKANDRILQKLGLDQAMLYATYSHGFHSGGVTAGALDTDNSGTRATGADQLNRVDDTGIPCPPGIGGSVVTICTNYTSMVEDGYGTADPITFRPEKVVNYEVGFKAAGLDRRIQANIAAFYMDYTDMQTTGVATRFGIPVPYIENVGKSVIKGFELELVAMPTPQWRVFVNGSYTDADIKEWNSNTVPLNSDGTPNAAAPTYDVDRSDERMVRVPRWQFFGSTEYNFRLPGGGSITPSVGVRFTSSIYHGFDRGSWVYTYGGYYYNHGGDRPPTRLPSHASCTAATPNALCNWNGASSDPQADPLITPSADAKWKTTSRPTAFIDARLAWVSDDGKMEAALWGKNLTNKDDYLVGGIPLADVTGAVGQVYANPRTFGLTFTYHFGE